MCSKQQSLGSVGQKVDEGDGMVKNKQILFCFLLAGVLISCFFITANSLIRPSGQCYLCDMGYRSWLYKNCSCSCKLQHLFCFTPGKSKWLNLSPSKVEAVGNNG